MDKSKLKLIIDKYKSAESEISELDSKYGICIYNARNENFFNKYNDIIFRLIEDIVGYENKCLIEEYIFEQTDMTFDELCNILGYE